MHAFVADDHSRVILQRDGPEESDYINANYILVRNWHLITLYLECYFLSFFH
jgi:protein tyrosine phosphatase